MKIHYIYKPIFALLLVFIFLNCCKGQTKTNSETNIQTKTLQIGHPKLVKTQRSTEGDNVLNGLQDKLGNLWFVTTGEGVYRYDGKLFTQFTKNDGLSSNCVYSILEDNFGIIWFGTSEGICNFDGKKIKSVSIPFSIRPITNNNNFNELTTKNAIWSMLQDKSGIFWFGAGDGVYCYNGFTFTRFLYNDGVMNKDKLNLKMIDCILEDKNGNIWFASGMPPGGEGVCRYDGKSISSFKPNGDVWIRYIKEDKKGILWFGGRNHGNFTYDGEKFTVFNEKVGIGNSILVDKHGNTWFNGEEKQYSVESKEGIWCYDGHTFKNFNTIDGMSKYFVWFMLEDKNGNIWIGTRNTGLYKYDGKKFINFS